MGLFLENSEVMSSPCWGSGATASRKKVQQMLKETSHNLIKTDFWASNQPRCWIALQYASKHAAGLSQNRVQSMLITCDSLL